MAVCSRQRMARVTAMVTLALCGYGVVALAAGPTAEQALKLTPVQKDVEIDRPTPEQIAKCTIAVEKLAKGSGWMVKAEDGRVLRRFLDTNGDNVVDQWSYYEEGFEVYRDIDSDFNGKADQFRWLGAGGTRWAIDKNEDGKVDSWKSISAEEVSAEVVDALAAGDVSRFLRLKLTPDELSKLGLGDDRAKQLEKQLGELETQFTALTGKQALPAKARWVRFDAMRPGVIAADGDAVTADIKVYENVLAIAKSGEQQQMVQVGTLVQVGDCWRVIDLPKPLGENAEDIEPSGFFFRMAASQRGGGSGDQPAPSNPKMQELISELEKLDKAEKAGGPQTKLRVGILEKLVDNATGDDRKQWLRQLADTLGLLVHTDPDGNAVEQLDALKKDVKDDDELAAHVEFLWLMADYSVNIQKKDADFAKLQTAFLANLESFVKSYPKAADTPEALLQLGMAQELAGQDEEALKWYGLAVKHFPDAAPSKKAAGASRRLDSVGKQLKLSGKTLGGQAVDLAKLEGRVVLLDYWATWCGPCKEDFETLKQLVAKYGKSGFVVIGLNLDSDEAQLSAFLKQNRLPWPHMHEPGGLDSRLALELGILTLPTKILIDAKGRVVNRNIHASQIEDELKKMLKTDAPPTKRTAGDKGGAVK